MTLNVTMKRDVLHNGVLLTNGSAQALPDDVARQFVYEQRATMVSVDTPALRTPVQWSDMTGTNLVKPDGTLIIKYNPASVAITGGTINGATIGQTTPAAVKTSNLQMVFADSTATPGNVTNNSPRGKVSFAAAASTIVVTNSLVALTSSVIADMNAIDGALNAIISCKAAAGSFTITGNAAATTSGLAQCDFIVIN